MIRRLGRMLARAIGWKWEIKYYDPSTIEMTFNGVKIQGYAESSFVEMESESTFKPEPAHVAAVGSKTSGTVTFTLVSESAAPCTLFETVEQVEQSFPTSSAEYEAAHAVMTGWQSDLIIADDPHSPIPTTSQNYADAAAWWGQSVDVPPLPVGTIQVQAGAHIPAGWPVTLNAQGQAVPAAPLPAALQPLQFTQLPLQPESLWLHTIMSSSGYHRGLFDAWVCPCLDVHWGAANMHCMYCGRTRAATFVDICCGPVMALSELTRLPDDVLVRVVVELNHRHDQDPPDPPQRSHTSPARRRRAAAALARARNDRASLLAWLRVSCAEVAHRDAAREFKLVAWVDALLEGRDYDPEVERRIASSEKLARAMAACPLTVTPDDRVDAMAYGMGWLGNQPT